MKITLESIKTVEIVAINEEYFVFELFENFFIILYKIAAAL